MDTSSEELYAREKHEKMIQQSERERETALTNTIHANHSTPLVSL